LAEITSEAMEKFTSSHHLSKKGRNLNQKEY
jgi:hypothetical protein